jgi:hypothetical protein
MIERPLNPMQERLMEIDALSQITQEVRDRKSPASSRSWRAARALAS